MSAIRFYVTAYKTPNALIRTTNSTSPFAPTDGTTVQIHCNHALIGALAINMVGEIVGTKGNVSLPDEKSASVKAGTIFYKLTDFLDPKADPYNIYRVKDLVTLETFWVDASSYISNVVTCNKLGCAPIAVPVFTGASPDSGAVTLTISTAVANAAGYVFCSNTTNTPPILTGAVQNATIGTFTLINALSITQTSGTTLYYFMKSLAASGSGYRDSDWSAGVAVTAS